MNSFRVNREWQGATAAGTWSTKGLNRKDIKVLAKNNSNFIDSKSIGCVIVNGNTTETVISTINTWVDVNLNNSASEATNTERWRLIDNDNGSIENKSNEDYDNFIAGTVTITTPGTDRYEIKYVKQDLGSGAFNDLPDGIVVRMSTVAASDTYPINIPLTSVKTDVIKMQIRNIDGTDNITITGMAAGPA